MLPRRRVFEHEQYLLARLQHPNIVARHDFLMEGEHVYLVMEYVAGVNLRQLLDRIDTDLDPWVAIGVTEIVCNAIHYLHQRELIYADLKPGNVMLAGDGQVKLIDFGGCRPDAGQPPRHSTLHPAGPEDRTEVLGGWLGTPGYAAPEQFREVGDVRSDIYACGVLLHELLTRNKPARGETLKPEPHLPEELRVIIRQATAPRPEDRFASASLMAQRLVHYRLQQSGPHTESLWQARQQLVQQVMASPDC